MILLKTVRGFIGDNRYWNKGAVYWDLCKNARNYREIKTQPVADKADSDDRATLQRASA
ncbi:MAG: hypothetical protein F6J93_23915 [Oscillatoria sp. SIO1A7]|nr:hypothetical protein [Oscillatoria sp. SIO1A7]